MWLALGLLLGGALGFILGSHCEACKWANNALEVDTIFFRGGLYKVVEIHSPKSALSFRQTTGWDP